jgi:hypothetical protein
VFLVVVGLVLMAIEAFAEESDPDTEKEAALESAMKQLP